jgi:hypothetical protein
MFLTGCGAKTDLANLPSGTKIEDVAIGEMYINWNGGRYYMFGTDATSLKGAEIGAIDGTTILYEAKGYPTSEWLIEATGGVTSVGVLYKADKVIEIPEKLQKYNDGSSAISLKTNETSYQLGVEKITYTITNNTGKNIETVLIPKLERQTAEGYADVPFSDNVGFCGTADNIAESYSGEILTEWWGDNLTAGIYRLRFENPENETATYTQFELK